MITLEGFIVKNATTGAGVGGCIVLASDQAGRTDMRASDGEGNNRGWNFTGAAITYAVIPPAGYQNVGGGYLTVDTSPLEIALVPFDQG